MMFSGVDLHIYENEWHCEVIHDEAGMERLRPAWEELLSTLPAPSLFQMWEWVSLWWKHFRCLPFMGKEARLWVVATYRCGILMGVLPCYANVRKYIWEPSPLLSIGDGPRGVEKMTDGPCVLLRTGFEEAALQFMITRLLSSEQKHGCDYVHLYTQPMPNKEWIHALHSTAIVQPKPLLAGPQKVELDATWQLYRQSLTKSMRDNLAYYPRLLTRRGHAWQVLYAHSPEEVASATLHLIRLHRLRATSTRGVVHRNHIPTEQHADFLAEVYCSLARSNNCHIEMLDVNGVIVAAQAYTEIKQTLTFHYSGLDPEWYDFSPLLVIQNQTIQDAMLRGVRYIDLLPDAYQWKSRWKATEHPPASRYNLLRRSPIALGRIALRQIGAIPPQPIAS